MLKKNNNARVETRRKFLTAVAGGTAIANVAFVSGASGTPLSQDEVQSSESGSSNEPRLVNMSVHKPIMFHGSVPNTILCLLLFSLLIVTGCGDGKVKMKGKVYFQTTRVPCRQVRSI